VRFSGQLHVGAHPSVARLRAKDVGLGQVAHLIEQCLVLNQNSVWAGHRSCGLAPQQRVFYSRSSSGHPSKCLGSHILELDFLRLCNRLSNFSTSRYIKKRLTRFDLLFPLTILIGAVSSARLEVIALFQHNARFNINIFDYCWCHPFYNLQCLLVDCLRYVQQLFKLRICAHLAKSALKILLFAGFGGIVGLLTRKRTILIFCFELL